MAANRTSDAVVMRKSSITISLMFHAMVFIIAVVSFPFFKKDYDIAPPVSVELVSIDELNQTTKQAPRPEKKVEKKVEKPPAPPKPAPAPTNTAKEITKLEKTDKKEDVKKDEKVLVDPTSQEKMTKKEEKKKQVTEATPEEKMKALLKNLAIEEDTSKTEKKPDMKLDETAPPDEGRPVPLGARMTMTEMEALRGQLEACWTKMPAGAKDAENLAVDVYMTISRDRRIQSARIVDQGRYNSDSFFRAVADSVKWALNDPNCSPLEVPPDKYDTWKSITITFDPSQIF